jgi:hypothetical protein
MNRLNAMCHTYGLALYNAVTDKDLEPELFDEPDHIAYRSYDRVGFDSFLEEIREFSDELSYVNLDNRRMGAAWFMSPIAIKEFGNVHWLEVIEPAPEDHGNGIVSIEHMEFYYPDLDKARYLLERRALPYTFESDWSRCAVTGVIDIFGFEVKFTDQRFGDRMADHMASGEVHVISQNGSEL